MRPLVSYSAAVAVTGAVLLATLAPKAQSADEQALMQTDEHAHHDAPATLSSPSFSVQTGLPASLANAAQRIADSPRRAEWVAIKVNATDSVMAWVVHPQRSDKAAVVVVIHENTGINTWTRAVADQVAADGFIGIAPDLTTMFRTGDLKADPTSDAGRAAIGKVTPEIGTSILNAVAKYGMALPNALPEYGIVGFCWGGARSFLHATTSPSLGASVVYYGSPPSADQMAAIKAPVLGLYGGNDARINATIPATDSTMQRLGKSYESHIFDGAGHGFLRAQDNNEANAAAAAKAWPLTIAFFREHLGQ